MNGSAATATGGTVGVGTHTFWERFWRGAGLQFVGLFIVASLIYGAQPHLGASAEELAGFYQGERTRVLIGTMFLGLNLLNLLWFAAALRVALEDAGQGGWGSAATAASAVFGGLYLLHLAIGATLALSTNGSGNSGLTSALNDLMWALGVLISFPRAMLIMSGVFGLWRAGRISNGLFSVGLAGVVLGVLGGTTWLSGGVWAPDGVFTRIVSPAILLLWVIGVSRVLLHKSTASRAGW